MTTGGEAVSGEERLNPRRRLVIGVIAIAVATAGFDAGRIALRPEQRVAQPVQFSHLKHVKDLGMECATCHEHFATSDHSGLPSLALCQTCHAEPLTDSPEERELLQLAGSKPPPRFRKLFRMADHVRYSHSRHVTSGGIACESCHGAIAETTTPPPRPLVRITMETCTGCHADRGIKTDCTHCHR